jgi:hypothetical protein
MSMKISIYEMIARCAIILIGVLMILDYFGMDAQQHKAYIHNNYCQPYFEAALKGK